MTWVRIDDTFPNHPKVLKAGPEAAWLYVACVCHSGHYLTDGFVDVDVIETLTRVKSWKRAADALVRVGLLDEVAGGYQIHDYLDHQKSKETAEKERSANRERQRTFRDKSRTRNAVTNTVTDGVTDAEVTEPPTHTPTPTDRNPLTPTGVGGRNATISKPRHGTRADGSNPRAIAERELEDRKAAQKVEQLRKYAEMRRHLPSDEFLATANHDLFPAEVTQAVEFHQALLEVAS